MIYVTKKRAPNFTHTVSVKPKFTGIDLNTGSMDVTDQLDFASNISDMSHIKLYYWKFTMME